MSSAVSPGTSSTPADLEPRAYAHTLRRILVLLVGVGVVIRIVRLALPSAIWGDEAMLGLNFLDRDYFGLTRMLDNGQVAPILFLWVERFIAVTLGTADWMMRIVPFLASVSALFIFWDFARRTVTPTAATLAVGIMAVSVWPVSMAATVKPYAGDLFWSALLLSLAARWHQRPERLAPLIGLVLAIPVALGSSYPTVFVAGGVTLYLLPVVWGARRRAQVLFLLYNLAMVATFAATYLLVGRAQIDPNAGTTGTFMLQYWQNGFPPSSALEWPLWLLQTNTGRMFAYPLGDANGGSSISTILFLIGVWWCWRNGSRPLLIACLVPFGLNLIAACLGKYPYAGCCRLSQHLAPAICLLVGTGWASILDYLAPRRSDRLRKVYWAAGFLILLGTGGLICRCVKLEHDPVAQFGGHLYEELKLELQPGDYIVVHEPILYDVSTQWYLKRFGDRLIQYKPGQPLPEAKRLWIITMTPEIDPQVYQQEMVNWAKGFQAKETFSYSVRPERDMRLQVWWYGLVTCMVHPGDDRPVRMNASP